jgi:catechol 2,3-dioxygenase-like lactoylglutathione lyase family enzyme
MSPLFDGLAEVMIVVDDLAASRAWFAEFLELEPYLDLPDAVGFRIGGNELHLRPADATSPAGSAGAVAYWQDADVDTALRRAERLGAVRHRGPGDIPESGIRICQIREPNGTVVGILERLRRSTEALDARTRSP